MMLGKFGETLRKKRKEKKGFTLLELIIVIAIIAILLALLVPNLSKVLGKASATSKNANAKTVYTSASTWAAELASDNKTVGVSAAGTSTVTIKKGVVTSMGDTGFAEDGAEAKALLTYINDKKSDISFIIKDDYSIVSATCDGETYPKS